MSYSWLVWMVIAYLISTTGDILLKKGWPWIGALVYASATPFWFEVLKQKNLSQVAIASSVIGNTILLTGAFIFLGETLTTKQWIGFAVGLVAVYLMD